MIMWGIQERDLMTEDRFAPCVVRSTPGAVLAPEPHPADYEQEIPEDIYALVDELCPQDIPIVGRVITALDW